MKLALGTLLLLITHLQGLDCVPQFYSYVEESMRFCHSAVEDLQANGTVMQEDMVLFLHSYYLCVFRYWKSCQGDYQVGRTLHKLHLKTHHTSVKRTTTYHTLIEKKG